MVFLSKQLVVFLKAAQKSFTSTSWGNSDGYGKNAFNSKSRVVDSEGKDVTAWFVHRAEETLQIAKLFGITDFTDKAESPSCGCGRMYDALFSRKADFR